MDPLKEAWKNAGNNTKSTAEMKEMLKENKHPVLRKIRIQMIVEIVGFTAFGLVFYDFFDGHKKPLYVIIILVASLLLVIFHNLIGYFNTKRSARGDNLRVSLEKYEQELKTFALISILSRVIYTAGTIIYFAWPFYIKLWPMLLLLALVVAQVIIVARLWRNRIRAIDATVESLKEGE
ncbi:hypothetical protein [Chitinophaga niabensis]|uniref:Uncharacterized protein n=1 Tax=Chitinophaga niabensis TaxID=536979 RepID=A0A1N6DUZ7_9BACT|nr:hypothetical protein [Chitinophaga niabensis]SIN74602.1 hypothetical protein SAMN04488055_1100 [Chitinophaga niabensis]